MTRRGLAVERVSIDQILDQGEALHNLGGVDENLHLGPLPPETLDEDLQVEIWDHSEGRVVDSRYRPERDPPHDSAPTSKVEAQLSMNDPDLKPGDYVVGIVRDTQSESSPELVTGGYRIEIPETRPGEIVIAQVEEAETQRFGANSAKATRIDYPSAFLASNEADLGFKRLMSDGSWRKPRLGRVECSVLPETVRRVEEERDVSILNPGFDPDFPLRVVIELLYQADPGTNVALLTSGTSVHWGQKGEIRDAYRGYGLAVNEGEIETAVPIDQVFAHSYVHDNEMKTSSESLLDRRLVLTKKIEELSAVNHLSAIVVDFTSRKPGTDEETIDELRDRFPNTPIVSIASPYTKNEGEGVPRYGPPSFFEEEETLPNATDIEQMSGSNAPQVGRATTGSNDDRHASGPVGSPIPPSTTDLLGLLREPSVEVQSIEGGELSQWFEMATDHFSELLDNGIEQAAYKIYSVEMFFERLPVSPHLYNEWIRQRYAEGKRYLPETTDGILEDLDTYGGQIEDLQAPASIFGAVKALREIEDRLRSRNPMFQRILNEVSDAVEEDFRMGVFCPRKSWVPMLREALHQSGISEDAIGTNVLLLDSDSIRDMPPCRRLLFTGPQRPQYAGFYLHPRAKETVILTYDGRWRDMVEKHAKRYVRQLNLATAGTAEGMYPIPILESENTTEVELETDPHIDPSETVEEDLPKKGESSTSGADQTQDLDNEALHRLAQLVELSPTKNGELADVWGYDSGSEVYQYLSANLNEFYTRNEDKLIIPTEEGERAVKDFRDERSSNLSTSD